MDRLMRRLNEQNQYLKSKNQQNDNQIQINFCSIPLNNGIEEVKDQNNEVNININISTTQKNKNRNLKIS